MKLSRIAVALLLVSSVGLMAAPQAEAFTIFGVKFFEKNQPEPTPKVTPTPTPGPLPETPENSPEHTEEDGQVLSDQNHEELPSTGPEQSVAVVLLGISGAFIARKFWLITHQV